MLRVLLFSCLLAGGLSSKLPSGPEHRSLGHGSSGHHSGGHHSSGHHSDSSGNGYSYGQPSPQLSLAGSRTQYRGSGSQPAGSRVAAAPFGSSGRPSGSAFGSGSRLAQNGAGSFSSGTAGFRQGAGSSSTFASASGSRREPGSSGSSASSGYRQGGQGGSFAGGSQSGQAGFRGAQQSAFQGNQQTGLGGAQPGGYRGPQSGQAGFRGSQAAQEGFNNAQRGQNGQGDDGLYRPQNLEAQFDNGGYRAEELNSVFDDGAYKPTLYSGDDGLYRDDQYAPNNDASYQFQFDAGDHGRAEAADVDGEVEGNFYAVHPNGVRRDVEFSAGREGFVVTRDESVQGPVPEYALRAAAKPKKVYPEAEIRTSLSPDGIYHWEYDAGESSRSEDINLNTNFYEGTFDFTADDDQNKYRVDYVAGAGIGFVPSGDHLPEQVEETPEVAEAKANFLQKFAEAEADAKASLKNGYQQAYQAQGSAFQGNRQRPNNFGGQAGGQGFRQQNNRPGYSAPRPQVQNQGFRPQGNNQGYSAPRTQTSSGLSQTGGRGVQGFNQRNQYSNGNGGYTAPRGQNQSFKLTSNKQPLSSGTGFSKSAGQPFRPSGSQSYSAPSSASAVSGAGSQNSVSKARPSAFSSTSRNQPAGSHSGSSVSSHSSFNKAGPSTFSSASRDQPASAHSGSRFTSAGSHNSFNQPRPSAFTAARRDDDVHPSMMVASHALGGHVKTTGAASSPAGRVAEPNNSYLPPN